MPIRPNIHRGDLQLVAWHLAHGVPVDSRGDDGWTPLMYHSLNDHLDVVNPLLAHGADANAKNAAGAPALMIAILHGHGEIAGLLVAKGADVNASNKKGVTALLLAVTHGDLEFVRFLTADRTSTARQSTATHRCRRRPEMRRWRSSCARAALPGPPLPANYARS